MKSKLVVVGFVMVATVLVAQMPAFAQGRGMHGGGMMGPGGFMMAAYLGLTSEQQSQLKTLRQTEWTTDKPLVQQLATYRQQLRQLTESNTPLNTAQLNALAGEIAQIQSQLTVAHAQTEWQFFNAILTADQQAKLLQLQQQMQQMRQNHHNHNAQNTSSNQ